MNLNVIIIADTVHTALNVATKLDGDLVEELPKAVWVDLQEST